MTNIAPDNSRMPQPEDKVFIDALKASPYPDRRRVRVEMDITPFQKRPNLLLVARNDKKQLVAELDVIEAMHTHLEFTLHIRNVEELAGAYDLMVDLFFETRNPPQDRKTVQFVIPEIESGTE